MDECAEQGMDELQREDETPCVDLGVRDRQIPGTKPAGQAYAQAAEVDEVTVAPEDQRTPGRTNLQRHADAAANVFLEPRRPAEALAGMDHLRKPRRRA